MIRIGRRGLSSATIGNPFATLARDTLKKYDFTDNQSLRIVEALEPFLGNGQLHQTIERSLAGWKRNVLPKNDNSEAVQESFKRTFYAREPRLLLIDEEFIDQRSNQIRSLDLIRGLNDMWRIFHLAPSGYFLQDWNEFLKKYYYITYKILPVLNGETKIKHQQIHPLVQCPKVMEQSYENIKNRFIFVQRTAGFKTSIGSSPDSGQSLYNLFIDDETEFLRRYAPNCTAEELSALQRLNATDAGQEDDQIFEDLVRLSPQSPSSSSSRKSNARFLEDSLDQGIILSRV